MYLIKLKSGRCMFFHNSPGDKFLHFVEEKLGDIEEVYEGDPKKLSAQERKQWGAFFARGRNTFRSHQGGKKVIMEKHHPAKVRRIKVKAGYPDPADSTGETKFPPGTAKEIRETELEPARVEDMGELEVKRVKRWDRETGKVKELE